MNVNNNNNIKENINYGSKPVKSSSKKKIIVYARTRRSLINIMPVDILKEILYNIPIVKLLKYTTVCKAWYNIINIQREKWTRTQNFVDFIKRKLGAKKIYNCTINHSTINCTQVEMIDCTINYSSIYTDKLRIIDGDLNYCNRFYND